MKRFLETVCFASLFIVLIAGVNLADAQNLIGNGNFQGDAPFAQWTLFTTPNGTLGDPPFPQEVDPGFPPDTGFVGNTANFRVGEVNFTAVHEGGGIFQQIAANGPIKIRASVACDASNVGSNASGGRFQLLFDNNLLDEHDCGSISGGTIEFGVLEATTPAGGNHEVRILITRPFIQAANVTPLQFVDSVKARHVDQVVVARRNVDAAPPRFGPNVRIDPRTGAIVSQTRKLATTWASLKSRRK